MSIRIKKCELIENFIFLKTINNSDIFPNNIFEHNLFEQVLYKTNIKEGLIKTYPFEQVLRSLSQYGQTVPSEMNKQIYLNIGNIENIKQVLRHINMLGYIPAQFKTLPIDRNREAYNYIDFKTVESLLGAAIKFKELWIIIEPKFDKIDSKSVKYFYHLTNKKYLYKIGKNGLIPKTQSKKSFHPDRIYVTTTIDNLNDIIAGFTTSDNVNEFIILQIDYEIAGRPELHNDPNYFTYGYYLIDNIPPKAIIDKITIE